MNYLAFDIETARTSADGEDWNAARPLGISCYALAWRTEAGVQSSMGYGKEGAGNPQAKMSQAECRILVEELADRVRQGALIVTWNGLGFDFDILAEESGLHAACCELARNHIDMMFHFFCLRGHPLGLDTAAKGMGLAGKPEGMDGSQAPVLWLQGEYEKVLAYVTQDALTTLTLAEAVNAVRQIRWQTRKGKPNRVAIARWLTVNEARNLPQPNTKWVRNPMPRERFTGWMDKPR
jgi:hypothetical protein